MRLVPTVRTVLTTPAAIEALHQGCLRVLGSISPRALAIIVAQSALETGRWRSLYCFDYGNEKAIQGYAGDYYMIRCNEIINGKLVWFDPPHPQTWFRAFPDAATGAESHVRFLSQSKRYANAWQEALAGDPAAYVHELHRAGYFTASEALYLRGVVSLFDEFLAYEGPPPAVEVPGDPCVPSDVRCPMSNADLDERLKDLDLGDDWRDALAAQRKADQLENDLNDATSAAALALGPTTKSDD